MSKSVGAVGAVTVMAMSLLTLLVLSVLSTSGVAAAQSARTRGGGPTHHAPTQHHQATEHAPVAFALDTVTGFGNANFVAVPEVDAAGAEVSMDTAEVVTGSMIVGAAYELGDNIGVGVRLPIVLGQWQDRTESVLGNVELEGEYGQPLSPHAYLRIGLGVALPVAQGRELPEAETLQEQTMESGMDAATLREYDRGALLAAAVLSRGLEDEALFEVDHLGIIPKLTLDVHYGHLLLGPFTRVENMLHTGASADGHNKVEWLVGSYAGVMLGQHIDVGGRAFADLILAGPSQPALIVEPQVTAHWGQFRGVLGGIWPLLGSESLRKFVGVRAMVSMRI